MPELDALAFRTANDLCLSFWAVAWERWAPVFPPNAKVLEIGCAEADWQTPMLALRPDLQITGIDWRACERPGTTVVGDAMQLDTFGRHEFDAIVSISAIEHVGLGAYDDDPVYEGGDRVVMVNAHYWLKPGGWMYLDVPYGDTFETHDSYRRYNDAALQSRLMAGFTRKEWAKCECAHPDGPYMALLLHKA